MVDESAYGHAFFELIRDKSALDFSNALQVYTNIFKF